MKRSSRLSVALHALVHLAKQPDQTLTSSALATCLMTNPVVVRRVLGALREAGSVAATRGPVGGWQLKSPAEAVTLRAVSEAMGESLLIRVESDPGDRQCGIVRAVDAVMADFLVEAEALLAARLETVTLADLSRSTTHFPFLTGAHQHG